MYVHMCECVSVGCVYVVGVSVYVYVVGDVYVYMCGCLYVHNYAYYNYV